MLENDFGSEVIRCHFKVDAAATVAVLVVFVPKILLNTFDIYL